MSEHRPPLALSQSFSGIPSPTTVSRPLKRRLTSMSDLNFFTPAATSFKPRPYTPNGITLSQVKSTYPARSHSHTVESLALPSPAMDPSESDPSTIFVHPPFKTFPDSHLHPDGLSYPLMASNPEWFLDPNDFISSGTTNPNAIPYPPNLEPPRGWCPAKKKDLKERGSDGWPEGEEPRLRCTFCRRTYAGVNAKSMWRRHVFEKHKIAMSNRREGNERPRGRGSNKENRQQNSFSNSSGSMISMDVLPQSSPDPSTVPLKSKFRSLTSSEQTTLYHARAECSSSEDDVPPHPAPPVPTPVPDLFNDGRSLKQRPRATLPPLSPPLTPRSPVLSNAPTISACTPVKEETPVLLPAVPPSPYDPSLTPSFRHTTPRLPSDQPWRFPSPSHPLHSLARELSLSMLAPDTMSPLVKNGTGGISSPLSRLPVAVLDSPTGVLASRSKLVKVELETPASLEKLPRPSSRKMFARFTPHTERLQSEKTPNESPLRYVSRRRQELAGSTLLQEPIDGVTHSGDYPHNADPFIDLYSWIDLGDKVTSRTAPAPPLVGESPVFRSSPLPASSSLIGLGIGLDEPFNFYDSTGQMVDFEDMLMSFSEEEAEVEKDLIGSYSCHESFLDYVHESNDGNDSSQCDTSYSPRKRRRYS